MSQPVLCMYVCVLLAASTAWLAQWPAGAVGAAKKDTRNYCIAFDIAVPKVMFHCGPRDGVSAVTTALPVPGASGVGRGAVPVKGEYIPLYGIMLMS